ncbi:relaxase, partial [Pseudomonas sp. MWU13-2860]
KAALKNPALTWSQLHQALAKHGLEIREKGQGFAIYDRLDPLTTPIKASDMHEQLSKSRLVKKLGPFEAPPQPVPAEAHYDKYQPPKRAPHMREVRREARAKGRKSLRERYARYRHAFIYRRLDPAGVRARFQTLRDEARKRRLIVRSSIPEAAQRRLLYSVIAFETMVAKDR